MGQKLNYAPLEVPQLQIMYVPTSQSIYPEIKTVAFWLELKEEGRG